MWWIVGGAAALVLLGVTLAGLLLTLYLLSGPPREAKKDGGLGIGEPKGKADAVVLVKQDTLTSNGPEFNNKPAVVYRVRLEANTQYVIHMRATDPGFGRDPYLILLNGQGLELRARR